MSDDYLWDRSGKPDEQVRRLEDLLSRYRYRGRRRLYRRLLLIATPLAAAAAILVAVMLNRTDPPAVEVSAWDVEWLTGSGESRLAVGDVLETGNDRVRIRVAEIGRVDLEPQSRVRLKRTGEDEHRLALDVGQLHAWVSAPPRLFVVDTPVVAAIDLGCEYTLTVDDDGGGLLAVETGAVRLEAKGRLPSHVSQGAICRIVPGAGPGIPWLYDAPEELQDLDASNAVAVNAALEVARDADVITLWHVLPRVDRTVRERVYDRMVALRSAPEGVSRKGILDLDESQLKLWLGALDPWSSSYDD